MIEFYGELSDEVKIDRCKRCDTIINKQMIGIIGFCLIWIFLSIFFEFFRSLLLGVILLLLAASSLLVVNNLKKMHNRFLRYRVLRVHNAPHIIINNEKIKKYSWEIREIKIKSLNKIKKVLDCGEWYYIIFKFGDVSNSWICQKDLLIKGTIEEFEKLFEDKIVRKTK